MLAVHGSLPADDQHFAFEYKWDGVRTIARLNHGEIFLQTRNLIDATHRYPELAALGEAISDHSATLDGEIVALDELDRPSFARLQQRMHLSDARLIARATRDVPIYFIIFDLLELDGRSTMNEPYVARREMLEELTLHGPCWQVTTQQVGNGTAMLEAAKTLGLEGVVAKRLNSIYTPGVRSPAWIKSKLVDRQEFVIGGWQEQVGQAGKIGALLVGYFVSDTRGRSQFKFAGRVGSGFNFDTHAKLIAALKPLEKRTDPFADNLPKSATPVHFVKPTLIAEVEFRGWTGGQMLRQPAFKGLREDKAASSVVRE